MSSLAFFLHPVIVVTVAVILLTAYRRASAPAGRATPAPAGTGAGA